VQACENKLSLGDGQPTVVFSGLGMTMTKPVKTACFPAPAAIDAYGNGGFRFKGMSHVGSLLCLPNGIQAWEADGVDDITQDSLARVIEIAGMIEILLIGTGSTQVFMPPPLVAILKDAGLHADCMSTGAAARTYNVLLAERRAVAAALIAVGDRLQEQ